MNKHTTNPLEQQLNVAPSEKHLEDWIDANLNQFGDRFPEDEYYWRMGEAHFRSDETFVLPYIDSIVAKQPAFPTGRPDLIGYSRGQITAVELKKGAITYEAIGQCLRYVHDLNEAFYWTYCTVANYPSDVRESYRYSSPISLEQTEYPDCEITGMVVGNSLEDKHLTLVAAACKLRLVTYEYVNGEYLFELQSVNRPHIDIYQDFARGKVGAIIRQVMRDRSELQKERGL